MTYNDIHRAIVTSIRSVTGAGAVSLENDRDSDIRGNFKLVEDVIVSSRATPTYYETRISYVLGYFPKDDEFKKECITFLERVQEELLGRGVNIEGETHLIFDNIKSEIDTDFPALIMEFDAVANFTFGTITAEENDNYEFMGDMKGALTYADITEH